jgi:hypothetical protein
MGRSGRRRKAKRRSVDEAAQRLLQKSGGCDDDSAGERKHGDESESSQSPNPVVHDRQESLPGALHRRSQHTATKGKGEASSSMTGVVKQLGYLPGNAIGVCARQNDLPSPLKSVLPEGDTHGDVDEPLVLQLYPLAVRREFSGGKADGRKFKGRRRMKHATVPSLSPSSAVLVGKKRSRSDEGPASDQKDLPDKAELVIEPFPTMYWLTSPLLKVLISQLELGGRVSAMQARLRDDPDALASMKQAHVLYGEARWALLTDDDVALLERRQWTLALDPKGRGVAGIRHHDSIKCFHAHAAHYLSGGPGSQHNVVGKWVMDALYQTLLSKKEEKVEASNNT